MLFADNAGKELITEREPFLVTLAINDLAIVQVGIVPVTKSLVFGHNFMKCFAAVGKHFGNMLAIVVAGVIESGESSGGGCG